MPTSVPQNMQTDDAETVPLDWAGLWSLILTIPKTALSVIAFVGVILFGFFGTLLFLPLIAVVLVTGPFRKILNSKQRRDMNAFVTKANAYIEERRKSNSNRL